MCLCRIDETFEGEQYSQERVAYKVFVGRAQDARLRHLWRFHGHTQPLDRGVWLTATQVHATLGDMLPDGSYPDTYAGYMTGFHCYVSREDAERYALPGLEVSVPVRIRNVRIRGLQYAGGEWAPTYVADEMLIEECK